MTTRIYNLNFFNEISQTILFHWK